MFNVTKNTFSRFSLCGNVQVVIVVVEVVVVVVVLKVIIAVVVVEVVIGAVDSDNFDGLFWSTLAHLEPSGPPNSIPDGPAALR